VRPPTLRARTSSLALVVLAVVLAACSLVQADRAVVRSFTYGVVIECRGDHVPSADGCREWGEGIIAPSAYTTPGTTARLVLTNERGRCQGMFLDDNGSALETFTATCP
jgi:hypothetical protein